MARIAIASLLALALCGCGAAAERPVAAVSERPAGTLVLATDSNRLTVVDVASGRRATRQIRSIPACGAQLFVTGGHIVFSGIVEGLTTVFSIPLALDRPPRRLGTAHQYVPSATEGRVWLAGTDCDRVQMTGVREVTVDGEVTFESEGRMPGEYLVGAVPDGLLLSRGLELLAWNPARGTSRPTGLEWAFGLQGGLVAGCAAGTGCDRLTIVDTADERRVAVSRDLDTGGVFSPDGSLLATAMRVDRGWRVALVDSRTGDYRVIRGSRTGRAYPELRWSSSGWLFIRSVRRLWAYRPGAPRAERLSLRLPVSTIAFAAA